MFHLVIIFGFDFSSFIPLSRPSPLLTPTLVLSSKSHYVALGVSDSSPAWQENEMLKLLLHQNFHDTQTFVVFLFFYSDYACLSIFLYTADAHH